MLLLKSCILHDLIDKVNNVSMEQDDPCILQQLRSNYLESPSKEKLNLEHSDTKDPSMGQSKIILEILNNKVCLLTLY